MKLKFSKGLTAVLIGIVTLMLLVSTSAFASIANWAESNVIFEGTSFGTNGYYNVISKKDYTLVPDAAVESEIVLNNSTGTRRQVMHIMELDPSNPDVSILPGYYGIDKDLTDSANWKVAGVTDVAAYYEDTLGYRVVGAMNTGLAYDNNAPYSWLVYNGQVLVDAKNGINNNHAGTCSTMLCVYKDADTDECSVELRTSTQGLRGDEWQAIGANFAMTVNNGELVNKSENHAGGSDDAARSMVGVKEDGTLVLVMNDGRGANNSKGFCTYELGESMLALGCKWAFNCDGGGSSSFVTRRAGEEDLVCRCVPCDGAERPTINSVIVVSNVAPTGKLDAVNVEADYDIFAPNTTYTFGTTAVDTHGYSMELPAEATWALSDDTFGTITNGTFTSNGKTGDVTVQVKLAGEVIGEKAITVANPTTLKFTADSTTLPYGKSTTLAFTSLIGEAEVYLDGNSFDFELDNAGGTLNGLTFTAGNDESIEKTVVTATYKAQSKVLTYTVNFGKGSEILYDFENGIEGWMGYDEVLDFLFDKKYIKEKSYKALNDYYNGTGSDNFSECVVTKTFLATAENGYVHNGSQALGIEFDFTQCTFNDWCYGVLFNTTGGVLRDTANGKKAITLGMWLRMPENCVQDAGKWANQLTVWKGTDAEHLSGAQIHFQYNGANLNTLTEEKIPENRWIYVTATLPTDNYVRLADADSNLYRSPSFLRTFIKPNVCTKFVWYIDDITIDYSSAVEDRVAPTITAPQYAPSDTNISFTDGVVLDEVSAAFTATIADDNSGIDTSKAQIYVDGNKVATKVSGNMMFCDNITMARGRHLVKFEVADNLGNYTTLTREIVSTCQKENKNGVFVDFRNNVTLSGHNESGTTPMPGSVYYIDVNTSGAEQFSEGSTITLSLNTANSWILEGLDVNPNFSVSYEVDETNPNVVTFSVDSIGKYKQETIFTVPVRIYNPVLTASSEATPQAVSGRSFTAALNVKCYSQINSYGNYDEFSIAEFEGNRIVTRHEHTERAVEDKDAELGVAGYTGRTYCDECQSIVDFGTTIPALTHVHSYELVDGQFVCSDETCGETLELGTGLVVVNGKNYYAIGGNLVSGWQQVDEDFYYFNQDYSPANGKTTINGLTFEFENGKLLHGIWVEKAGGTQYWYGPSYYHSNYNSNVWWQQIDDVTYGFNYEGYRYTSTVLLKEGKTAEPKLHEFNSDGSYVGLLSGFAIADDSIYIDGILQKAYQLICNNGFYYFIGDYNKIIKDKKVYLTGTYLEGTPYSAGYYDFNAEGKMVIKDGVVDGKLYIDGVQQNAYKLVLYKGSYYFVGDYNKVIMDKRVYLSATYLEGTPYSAGYFDFDNLGRMINTK